MKESKPVKYASFQDNNQVDYSRSKHLSSALQSSKYLVVDQDMNRISKKLQQEKNDLYRSEHYGCKH